MSGATPAALMSAEMAEQPRVLGRLSQRRIEVGDTVRRLLPDPLAGIALLARGPSYHAATYGRYLLEAATGRPVSLVAPSLHTLYRVRADYRRWLVIAVSQSGLTPDIITATERLRAAGARTLAITNDPDSPLAGAVDAAVDLAAGPERAVPATKTVTATMLTFALLASTITDASLVAGPELAAVPDSAGTILDDARVPAYIAHTIRHCTSLLTVARGYLYPAARECALNVRVTTGMAAEAYSAADLHHGPLAAVSPGLPVLSFSMPGPAAADVAALETELARRNARIIKVGTNGALLRIPVTMTEILAPIPAVIRGQQLARALAWEHGVDPDHPRASS